MNSQSSRILSFCSCAFFLLILCGCEDNESSIALEADRNDMLSATESKTFPQTVVIQDQLMDQDFNSYFEITDIISLETNETSLLNKISRILFIEDKFFIFDRNLSAVKVFNSAGQYLFNLGRLGKGPGEFIKLKDFLYDPKTNSIVLYSLHNMKLLRFNLAGIHQEDIDIPFYAHNFAYPNNDKFLFYTNYNQSEQSGTHNLLITDKDFKIEHRLLPYITDGHVLAGISFSGFLTQTSQGILVSEAFSDTVYRIQDKKLSAAFIFDFGDLQVPFKYEKDFSSKFPKLFNYGYITSNMIEAKNALSFGYTLKQRIKKGIWLKHKAHILTYESFDNELFTNLMFQVKGTLDEHTFIVEILPSALSEFLENDEEFGSYLSNNYPQIYQLSQKHKETDNPVLAFMKIK